MNFLAHIYLSDEQDQIKIGNFIADSVRGKDFSMFPKQVAIGIKLHRAIDSFTDTHPTVSKSKDHLRPVYNHWSSVITDIFYDHFLAKNWFNYSDIPLEEYVAHFYDILDDRMEILPERVINFMPYMIRDNWLASYATIDGIGHILHQMNERTGNRSKMNFAVIELEKYYNELEREFESFFEELIIFAKAELIKLQSQ